MREEWDLKGKKCRIDSIHDDGNRKVIAIYPESKPYGKPFHWEWAVCKGDDITIVAEAWPAQNGGGWWLKIKDPNL